MKFILTKLELNYFNIHKDKVNILLINRILCKYMLILIPNSHYMIKMKYMSCMLKLILHLFLYKYVLSCVYIRVFIYERVSMNYYILAITYNLLPRDSVVSIIQIVPHHTSCIVHHSTYNSILLLHYHYYYQYNYSNKKYYCLIISNIININY